MYTYSITHKKMKSGVLMIGVLLLLCSFAVAESTTTTYTTTTISQNLCYDTDATNYYTKGNTYGYQNGVFYNYSDTCSGLSVVTEYYCGGTSALYPESSVINCPSSYRCDGGRCLLASSTTTTSAPPGTDAGTCTDSDGGLYPSIKGNVSGTDDYRNSYSYADICMSDHTLKEYYCQTSGGTGYYPSYQLMNCSEGYRCDGGRCIYMTTTTVPPTYPTSMPTTSPETTMPPTTYPTSIPTTTPPTTIPPACHDSDGIDTSVRGSTWGTLNGYSYNYTDSCMTSGYVQEWYCGKGSESSEGISGLPEMITIACEQGYRCDGGRCIRSTISTTTSSTQATYPTSMPTTTPTTTVTTTTICPEGAGYNSCITDSGKYGICRYGVCWPVGACCYASNPNYCGYTNEHDCAIEGSGSFVQGAACNPNPCNATLTTTTTSSSTTTSQPNSCVDSDGTDYSRYYVKGNVSGTMNGHSYLFKDYCLDNYVNEWYCLENAPKVAMYIPCPFGCIDGACVQNFTITTTTTTPPISTPAYCLDTDGLDSFTRGTTTGWFAMSSDNYTYTDSCVNGTTVEEHFCRFDSGFHASIWIDCPQGAYCNEGRCRFYTNATTTPTTSTPPTTLTTPNSCHISGNWSVSVSGYVWGIREGRTYNYSDECKNDSTVIKRVCIASDYTVIPGSETVTCPENTLCSGGRCTSITENMCHDSDGINENTSGYAWGIYNGRAYNLSDTCKNSTSVNEKICITNGAIITPYNQTIDCPADAYCIEGRCVSSASDECHDVNARNTSIRGYIWGTYLGAPFNYTDMCLNDTAVNERFCIYAATLGRTISEPYSETTNCPEGTHCTEGICAGLIQDACNSLDDLNVTVRGNTWGTLNGRSYNYTDTCYSANYVQEFYCTESNNTLPQMSIISCITNETCKEGRCVSGNSSLRECNMPGNSYPCDQMTLPKVVNSINEWIDARINLGDVIRMIMSWSDPEGNAPN